MDGEWKAIKTSWTRPSISHLMFADYLLLFGQTTQRKMHRVIIILNKFCVLFGQRV